jgi:hypothetical protein
MSLLLTILEASQNLPAANAYSITKPKKLIRHRRELENRWLTENELAILSTSYAITVAYKLKY